MKPLTAVERETIERFAEARLPGGARHSHIDLEALFAEGFDVATLLELISGYKDSAEPKAFEIEVIRTGGLPTAIMVRRAG